LRNIAMKIALVTHNVIRGDGQGRVNYELTRYLLERGVHVTLLAEQVDPALLEAGAEWKPIRIDAINQAVDLVKVWRFKQKADRLLRDIGPQFDIILACGVVLSIPHTINAVHFAHGGWRRSPYHTAKVNPSLNGAYQWLFSVLNDRWERQVLPQAQRIVAVSPMVRDELVASGLALDKIDVIVNGVDTDEFRPGPADRVSLGLPPNVPLGLFVGDIRSPIKNPDGVLQALVNVPEAHLAVVGALEGSPLPSKAIELGIDTRVHFLGFRRDVAHIMRAADFFTLPSRRDSCPLVLLEAMASGLPAIVSQNVGTAYLVSDGAGFVLDTPDDLNAMSRYIQNFVQQPAQRDLIGQTARRIAKQHSWKRMASKYYTLFEEILSSTTVTQLATE
jgi:glycosyltransferase involved in cell wall biosynthesis